MTEIKNILVALDLSDIDNTLIEYASFIAETLKVKKVYFVHNIKKHEISELFEEQLKDINLDEIIGNELNDKVEEIFTSSTDWEVLISEDPYSESLINYIVNKYEIQLSLIGNKNKSRGTGVVSGKLLRMLKCNILSIPKNAKPHITTIWAGTDFSSASNKVFEVAENLQKTISAKVKAVHVYNVPVQFSPYIPKENLDQKIENHLKEKFGKFIKKAGYKGDLTSEIIPGKGTGVAEKLRAKAEASKVDLIIVGDKGRNTFSSLLVGSVTEELFNQDLEIPLWIVK
ncbi:Nucleotide-binding universal stress protein, UspA family [Flavobacterium omnivorum]|uniref:Nucleotide-binding universal stress protein, UspA family n=1 Tax=Flavobacterium omnivorum TaxID=178355 RepID=A0A1G8I2S3_9FLAO|nr:universal stress protein [Flavobacterium omnivorum]SDI13031.1 Nucleotide-binding universal stress protein, UspA family [Flavobacterium omnivorum]